MVSQYVKETGCFPIIIYVELMDFLYQVVKIDGRIIGDGQVGPITRRLQNAYRELTHELGVPIPTYKKA